MLHPIDYVPDDLWRKFNFYEVFPLDGGGYFSFLDLAGSIDDRTVAEATLSGTLFDPFRAPDGRIDWNRYDRWDTIEKGVWLNRWYALPCAGRMYRLTRDERFAECARDVIAQWREAVPPPEDYAAYFETFRSGFDAGDRRADEPACSTWCDFQLAQRVLSAYWIASFLRPSSSWDGPAWSQLTELITRHAELLQWADRDGTLEPGNHQMLRGFALMHAAAMLPDAGERETWQDLGTRLMTMHAAADFTADGISREGSFSYQLFMLSLFAHAVALARAMDWRVPTEWTELIRKMARFVQATATPALTTAVVNDGYEAPVAPVLEICRAQVPEYMDEDPHAKAPTHRVETFADAGVAVIDARADETPLWALVEALPPYGHSGHWHAGKPTLHVWIGDEMLLGDCGCPNYDDPLYGPWYRRGPAHLAVIVDGEEDAEFVADIRWEKPPVVKMTRCEQTSERAILEFTSTGFLRLDDPVDYVRQIEYQRGHGLTIRDRLRSRTGTAHAFRLHVPFLAENVQFGGDNTATAALQNRTIAITWKTTPPGPKSTLTCKPVSVGTRTGERPYLRIELQDIPEIEFVLSICAYTPAG